MFGLNNQKRKADLLLLSEALAITRSELQEMRREFEELQIAHEELKENFEELEIPEELDEYELSERIERVVRDEAWDYIRSDAEQMVENALNEYTTTEDLNCLLEFWSNTYEERRIEEFTKFESHIQEQVENAVAQVTAFVFALIEELDLTHKVSEMQERRKDIVPHLLNSLKDEL